MDNDYRHLKQEADKDAFKEGQEVEAVIYAFTDLGVKVAINDTHSGLAYKNEIFDTLYIGQKLKAFIKCIREDGKIDVTLRPREGQEVLEVTEKILTLLKESGGKLSLNDKSSPEDIRAYFQTSKKVFKKAIGVLYKQRKIKITDSGIEIVRQE
ncbi:MAG: type I-B CRISPR-associated protein Cas8b1/Cst1 [Candidatus Omnitrophica bacterium]|nr:type I-B CRISPR-associated protein Cas8b1/Cst1 [Candidatus Omnitrophota bacterium]